MSKENELFLKEFTKIKRCYSLKRCLHPGCKLDVIGAHSIQENGPLKYISDQVNTQKNQVYFLDNALNFSLEKQKTELFHHDKRRLNVSGIGNASIFTGFCIEHDALFDGTIENVSFEGNLEQCFFHCYRTFACHFHRDEASNKGCKQSADDLLKRLTEFENKISIEELLLNKKANTPNISRFNNIKDALEQMKKGVFSTLEDFKIGINERQVKRRNILDVLIKSRSYSEMLFCVKSVDGLFPIAAATVVHYLDDTTKLIMSSDGEAYSAAYAITIFPEPSTSKTHFIIGAVKESPNVAVQMKMFENLKQSAFLRLMSNLILLRGTNTYLSPRLYNVLTEQEKEELINIRVEHEALDTEFGIGYCDFHLFDNRFKE
jgi:hypothetical protein